MTNYVKYIAAKQVDVPTFKPLNPITYAPLFETYTSETTPVVKTTSVVESTPVSKSETPVSKNRLDKVVDYALSKAHSGSTHWCAKYVRQALESQGFKPGNSINGWEYDKAAKNMGWKEITDGSIKKGDLIVTKKKDGKGHVALATKDDADIWNDNTSSVSDFVSRGVPYSKDKVKSVQVFRMALKGMKFVDYSPFEFISSGPSEENSDKEEKPNIFLLPNSYWRRKFEDAKHDWMDSSTKNTTFTYSDTNVGKTKKFFNEKGLGISSFGFIGNFLGESGLDPTKVNLAEKKRSNKYGAGIYQISNERKLAWEKKHGKKFETASLEEQLDSAWEEAQQRPVLMRELSRIDRDYNAGYLDRDDAIRQATSAVLLGFENGSNNKMLTPQGFDLVYLKNKLNRQSYQLHLDTRTGLAIKHYDS